MNNYNILREMLSEYLAEKGLKKNDVMLFLDEMEIVENGIELHFDIFRSKENGILTYVGSEIMHIDKFVSGYAFFSEMEKIRADEGMEGVANFFRRFIFWLDPIEQVLNIIAKYI